MSGSSDALKNDAVDFAKRAVMCDQSGLVETAVFYYQEASNALRLVADTASATSLPTLIAKADEYQERAKQLQSSKSAVPRPSLCTFATKTQQQLDLERARFLVEQAFEEDEADNGDEAVDLYTQAVEFCISIKQSTSDKDIHQKVSRLAEQALERAESIKHVARPAPTQSTVVGATKRPAIARPLGTLLQEGRADTGTQQASGSRAGGGGGSGYSKEEINVLRTTSVINGREYVPFMSVDMRERFAYPVPFSDKHGKLSLSPKQKAHLHRWARPEDLWPNPQMIYAVSCYSIKQTIVSDCSFVASLAISAQYERRFKKQLITSIIYPQNRQGEPQHNPCGKYMVKLNINGVPRKVIVDDFLPVDRHGDLLCSYSNNRSELWVSLLEKAYMKVMGGYDFPGSNSNIDLHALTGWIPERIGIRGSGDERFDADKEFNKIHDRFHRGHCLVTVATGMLTDAEGERAGLVPTHAYAMIDIRNVKGQKLIQLKNPWSHLRWLGNFSDMDVTHWTPELKKTLNYDPKNAAMFDNGVFWIDYESLLRFFEVIYINWNPDLFPYTTCIHHTWKGREGPKKDNYSIGDNPQYRLHMKTNGPCAIWILLTRHITDKDDFANNREFITVLVYKTASKRVFYPADPPPYKDGVRINSPHYLCKMVEEGGGEPGNYVLVVSQYEKNNTIHYTLRVYATAEFAFAQIPQPYNSSLEKQMTCEWKGVTAGGCANYRDTHPNNPIIQLRIDNKAADNHILIELRGPKQYSVGFEVTTVSENVPNSPGSFTKKNTGDYRRGFCVLQLDDVSGGVYNIQACTFRPGQEGPFFLKVNSSAAFTLARLR